MHRPSHHSRRLWHPTGGKPLGPNQPAVRRPPPTRLRNASSAADGTGSRLTASLPAAPKRAGPLRRTTSWGRPPPPSPGGIQTVCPHHPSKTPHTNPPPADTPPPPPFSPTTAFLLLTLYALIYFLPFYLSPTTRPSPTLSRDDPSVIRARIRSVLLSCTLCLALTLFILLHLLPLAPTLHLLGISPPSPLPILRTLLLTSLLFAGPLFHLLLISRPISLPPWDIYTARALLAGPITEELLFRSASIPLLLVSRTPIAQIIYLSPLVFGLAHVHHFYEFRLSNPGVPAAAALARSVFQLGFTTVFGAYATFLYVRTGSLGAVCAVHAFCNAMGLPKLWGAVRREGSGRAATVGWTVGYYAVLVAGAWSWYGNLWGLTKDGGKLVGDGWWVDSGG